MSAITIKQNRKMGRGVYADSDFKIGQLIERCPVLILGEENTMIWKNTSLEDYVFGWGQSIAIALGYGSLYNHSSSPNACTSCDLGNRVITFHALSPIKKGQQIFINYGWDGYEFSS